MLRWQRYGSQPFSVHHLSHRQQPPRDASRRDRRRAKVEREITFKGGGGGRSMNFEQLAAAQAPRPRAQLNTKTRDGHFHVQGHGRKMALSAV